MTKFNPFFFGLTATTLTLFFTYLPTSTALWPIHDFLDHTVTLSSIWAGHSQPFRWLEPLPFVLGGTVPAGALGFSDLSIQEAFFKFLPTDIALSAIQITGRLTAFLGGYYLYMSLLSDRTLRGSSWAATLSGLTLALMPYWPVKTWTIASLALVMGAVANIARMNRPKAQIILLLVAPHMAYFAWGGFLQPLLVLLGVLISVAYRHRSQTYLLWGALASVTSSALAAAGLIVTHLSDGFTSHRSEWPRSAWGDWFQLERFSQALGDFPSVFLRGVYHFGTSFQGMIPAPVNAILILTSIAFTLGTVAFLGIEEKRRSNGGSFGGKSVVWILVATVTIQAVVAGFYVLESEGFTNFRDLFPVPFQLLRIVAFSPVLWAIAFGAVLQLALMSLRGLLMPGFGAVALVLVAIHGAVNSPSSYGRLSEFGIVPPRSNIASFEEYFQPSEYKEVLFRLKKTSREVPTIVTYQIDPMVTAWNGFRTLGGYVYNYPLTHKVDFLRIIEDDIAEPGGEMVYVRDWGSRLYLFDRGVEPPELKFDWCASSELGAQHVLSGTQLWGIPGIKYIFSVSTIHVHRIECPNALTP